MIDLSTEYLGLKLKNPIVVSSSPLADSVSNIRRMEDCGAAAVVLASLFEEQLILEAKTLDSDLSRGTDTFPEALDFLPKFTDYRQGHDAYLEHLRKAKAAVSIPVLASLNGATTGGWVKFAKDIEQAGADALELNTYALVTDARVSAADVEQQMVDLLKSIRQNVTIPIAVKLSPYFSSLPNLVARLEEAGANGIVLFNRFYQPDFDINSLEVKPSLHFSTSEELLLRLHWAAILYSHTRADIALTGGVHTAEDVLKSIMAGAQVAMTASSLHIHGIEHLAALRDETVRWMIEHEYESIRQMRGSLSRRSVPDTSPFERGNYIKTLSSYSLQKPQPIQ